jgi:hypothetical protein
MNWKIVETTSGDKKVGLVSDLPAFDEYLNLYDLRNWKEIIDIAIEEGQFGLGQYEEILYPNSLDWHDINVAGINIPEDSVMHRITFEGNRGFLVNKNDFDSAILALAEKLVEIHENDPGLPEGWTAEMREAISRLREKRG